MNTLLIEQSRGTGEGHAEPVFEDIIALLDLNSEMQGNLQAERLLELRARRDAMVDWFLENPHRAFEQEFTALAQLYEGRTYETTRLSGLVEREFVTRDAAREKADLHFIERRGAGRLERTVQVPGAEPGEQPFFITTKDDEIFVTGVVYHRGMHDSCTIDPKSDMGTKLLRLFFTHSDIALDMMFNRNPEDIEKANHQAKAFLRQKWAYDNR